MRNLKTQKQGPKIRTGSEYKNKYSEIMKSKIDRSQEDRVFRLCSKVNDSIDHVLIEYSELVQKEYKRRHGKQGEIFHCKQEFWTYFGPFQGFGIG